MQIAFFGTKPYDRLWFEPLSREYGCTIHFIESGLSDDTVILAEGSNAVCIFVNDYVTEKIAERLSGMGIKLILLRCAGGPRRYQSSRNDGSQGSQLFPRCRCRIFNGCHTYSQQKAASCLQQDP